MVEFENSYLRSWVDKSINLMYSEWLRTVSSEEYKEGNLKLVSFLQTYEVRNWIADSAKLGDISDEDEVWTIHELVPEMLNSNLKKVARVSGEDKTSYNKFKSFAKRTEEVMDIGPILIRQFITYKEAADWIGEIPA